MVRFIVFVLGLFPAALAQQTLWGQCGGIGWSGPTSCVSGACCTKGNDYYHQCVPGECTSPTPTLTNTAVPNPTTNAQPSGTFTNPVVYEDFADNDVFLGPDNAYYFSASNMHYSPGAPILRSYDLVNWEFIGHSLPKLDWGSNYDMVGGTAYLGGSWASTMRYRKSNNLWYWYGCIGFTRTYVYTAPSPTGPWTQASSINKCYYDCGLLIDDDDNMYIVYGNNNINLAQLSRDGLSEVRNQFLFSNPQLDGMEGNRLYKRNGVYYILNDHPRGQSTYIWKSNNLWGSWTSKPLLRSIGSPVPGGGSPHQGSLIQTPNGNWYFMSFTWAYPAGRMPVLAPITWGSDGFPALTTVNNAWGATYPNPLDTRPVPSWTGTDTFRGTALSVHWEWNHNPDTSKYTVNNGLTLRTVTVTNDLYRARNTLTRRTHGPFPVATIELDFNNMADGDRAGLAAFRDRSAWIGIVRSGTSYSVTVVHNIIQNLDDWSTPNLGNTVATASIPKGKVWLRGNMDVRPNGAKQVTFSYSTDGSNFRSLGTAFALHTAWQYFPGIRWGIFNYATRALGGSVLVSSFTQT